MRKVIIFIVTACLLHTSSVIGLIISTTQYRHSSRSTNTLPLSSVVATTVSSRSISSIKLAAVPGAGAVGSPCRIKVIGVGGGGGNVVNRMIETSPTGSSSNGLDLGVEMWVINTDAQVGASFDFDSLASIHYLLYVTGPSEY